MADRAVGVRARCLWERYRVRGRARPCTDLYGVFSPLLIPWPMTLGHILGHVRHRIKHCVSGLQLLVVTQPSWLYPKHLHMHHKEDTSQQRQDRVRGKFMDPSKHTTRHCMQRLVLTNTWVKKPRAHNTSYVQPHNAQNSRCAQRRSQNNWCEGVFIRTLARMAPCQTKLMGGREARQRR
jgi:hypothetical protein